MTCVWEGIRGVIPREELLQVLPGTSTLQPTDLVAGLQRHNVHTPDVIHQGSALTVRQIIENQEAIRSITNIADGYLCSGCEPVLCLICQLFNYNITHIYNGVHIYYSIPGAKGTLTFGSSTNHFWGISRTSP